MNAHEQRKRVTEDKGFVALKRFDYDLEKLLGRYPEGAPDRIIAQALMLSEQEVEELYQQTILKLRGLMGVTE